MNTERDQIVELVGEFDDEKGLSKEQHLRLVTHMHKQFGAKILNSLVVNSLSAVVDENLFFTPMTPEDDEVLYVLKNWLMSAHTVVLQDSDADEFCDYMRDNPVKTFAGKDADYRFLTANTLFGVRPSDSPWIIPLSNEPDGANMVKVRTMTILVNCHGMTNPFPHTAKDDYDEPTGTMMEDAARFRRVANIVVWLTTNDGFRMYAGTMSYLRGGAKLHRCKTTEDLSYALNGLTPPNQPAALTRLGAFCASMITGLHAYLGEHYHELTAHLLEQAKND